MKPSEVKEAIKMFIGSGIKTPLFVHGSPGVGKSDTVYQVGKDLGYKVISLRSSLLDPTDLRGIPTIIDKVTHWCPPVFLPREEKTILFLDELPQAAQMVQSALLQLTLDRQVGEFKLLDDTIVIAAGNRQSDRAGVHKIITPLLNRFVHLDFDANFDDWMDWASKNNIHPTIQYFLKWRNGYLNNFEQCGQDRAFATPRSWTFASAIINASNKPVGDMAQLLEGAIGKVATEFIAFVRLKDKLPDIELIMKEPETAPVPVDEAGVLWALCSTLAEKCKDQKNWDSYFKYALRLPPEYAVMSYKQIRKEQKTSGFGQHPMVAEWQKKFKKYITQ